MVHTYGDFGDVLSLFYHVINPHRSTATLFRKRDDQGAEMQQRTSTAITLTQDLRCWAWREWWRWENMGNSDYKRWYLMGLIWEKTKVLLENPL